MKKKLLAGIAVLLLAFLYYYIELPAINIHESGFWFFLVAVIGIIVVVYAIRKRLYGTIQLKQSKGIKAGVILMLVIIAVYAVGSLLSSPIINAKKYQNLVTRRNGTLQKISRKSVLIRFRFWIKILQYYWEIEKWEVW